MNLFTDELKNKISREIITPLLNHEYTKAALPVIAALDGLYKNIPDNRRASYGRVHALKELSRYLFKQLQSGERHAFPFSALLFDNTDEVYVKGVALGIIAECSDEVLSSQFDYFKTAAASENWDLREFAQMYFKKIIKRTPEKAQVFLTELTKSEDPNIRRFVSECLRPVRENSWFTKQPEYPLSILRNLFRETCAYPRTSVGNNLSDHSRKNPELIFSIIEELVSYNDPNSYWIACRGCRNLVKTAPLRVMDILKTDEYKYKKKVYKRSEYQGD